ncbi:hypothetical protein [Leeia sp.]|uniref:hypothetical protein n=1 Tax=Leeia sp. TaxID=2884678 RepID=UPI0035AEC962
MRMLVLFDLAAVVILLIGVAHSWLGERYLLQRLARLDNLPRLYGGTAYTMTLLRFAWHITTLAWLGLAGVLVLLARPTFSPEQIGRVVGLCFLLQFAVSLWGSRGKHLSWLGFLLVGVLALLASSL